MAFHVSAPSSGAGSTSTCLGSPRQGLFVKTRTAVTVKVLGTSSTALQLHGLYPDPSGRSVPRPPRLLRFGSNTFFCGEPLNLCQPLYSRGELKTRCAGCRARSWQGFFWRRGRRGQEQSESGDEGAVRRRSGRSIVLTERITAVVAAERNAEQQEPTEGRRKAEAKDVQGARTTANFAEGPQNGTDKKPRRIARTALAFVTSINLLGQTNLRQSWSVPWKGDTIFQVMFLWFMAFWFIGSWLIPVASQLAGFNHAAMSLRAQAVYSLSTDLAEMAVGLSILNRCLSRFRPLAPEWFRFKPKGRWYLDALFACSLFPVIQLLSRINTSLLPVTLKFQPAVRIEQSINSQDPVATLIYATTVAFCAPVWEEVVFRGFLLPSLTRYIPAWGSILVSAAVFSLAHFSLQRLLPLFFLGIVLGVVFARSQNLLTAILLHSLWNCFVFLDLLM